MLAFRLMSPSPSATDEPSPDSFGDKPVVTRRDWISLWSVLLVQAQNAFNDNFVKITLIGLALIVAQGSSVGDDIERILSALIPIPFILLAPIAGYFSDRFSKRQVIFLSVVAQLAIFVFIGISVTMRSIPLAVFGFFLLAVQSTFFSPAKQGILKELVGSDRLGFANGFMQMLTMVGILAGMWLGGLWFDHLLHGYNLENGVSADNAWRAALLPIIVIGAGTLIPLILVRFIEPTPSHPSAKFRKSMWVSHFVELAYLFSHRKIRIVALLIAFYWLVANFLALTVVGFARGLNTNFEEGGITSGSANMMAFIGVGLMIGSLVVSFLSKTKVRIGLIPLGAFGMGIGILGIGGLTPGSTLWSASFALTGLASGFYLIPLAATLQDLPEEQHRGRVLAAANLLGSLSGIVAIGVSQVLTKSHMSPSAQTLLFILPLAWAGFYVFRLPKILSRQA